MNLKVFSNNTNQDSSPSHSINTFLEDESGQAIVEYVMLLAVVIFMVKAFFEIFVKKFREKLEKFAQEFQQDLSVGTCQDNSSGDNCFIEYAHWVEET